MDHRIVLDYLAHLGLDALSGADELMKPVEPDGNRLGVKWMQRITWPDRLPGLVTWGGQQTLAKLIKDRQKAVKTAPLGPLLQLEVPMKGVSGFDNSAAADPLDIGFNPAAIDMPIMQRPAVELLAIVGLECVPLISFSRRVVGFCHGGHVWQMKIEPRGKYGYFRWPHLMHDVGIGALEPADIPETQSVCDA